MRGSRGVDLQRTSSPSLAWLWGIPPHEQGSPHWGHAALCGTEAPRNVCDVQPSCGQSRERQKTGRIPQETAGTYHALLFKFCLFSTCKTHHY